MNQHNVQRNFIVGQEWIYFKIYTGTKTADKIITDIIKPNAQRLIAANIIDKWFFIRYGDPKPHLRVRLHCIDMANAFEVFRVFTPELYDLVENEVVWKIQLDTYNRELERYGHNSIELAESFFYYDSLLITDILSIVTQNDEDLRWKLGLVLIDNLLSLFKFSQEQKLTFMYNLKTGFASEFNMNKQTNVQMDIKYRSYKNDIYAILIGKTAYHSEYSAKITDFNRRAEATVNTLLSMRERGELQVSIESLLSSYIHMSMVRLVKSKNRLHEMVMYDFLYRSYKSFRARELAVK